MAGQAGTADAEQVPVQPKEQNSVQGVGGEVATKGPSARHYTIALPRVRTIIVQVQYCIRRRTGRPPRPPPEASGFAGLSSGRPRPVSGVPRAVSRHWRRPRPRRRGPLGRRKVFLEVPDGARISGLLRAVPGRKVRTRANRFRRGGGH